MKLRNIFLTVISAVLLLTGCQSEQEVAEETVAKGMPVIFGANIVGMVSTRDGENEEGMVNEGEFNLVFFNANNQLEVGKTIFKDGLGICYRYKEDGDLEQLIWEWVGSEKGQGLYSFWLNNLSVPEELFDENFNEESLKAATVKLPVGNPYRASKLSENPEADLLWGRVYEVPKAQSLMIDLKHLMAAFQVRIYVNDPDGTGLTPKLAKITNICKESDFFYRENGSITARFTQHSNDSGGSYSAPDEDPYYLTEGEETISGWNSGYDEEREMAYYDSPDYIIPPQMFLPSYRARLSVEVEGGQVYSGVFPTQMYVQNSDGSVSGELLRFKEGCKLKISVEITSDELNLGFEPVYYYDWSDKGSFNALASQASLENDEDFASLIAAYYAGKSEEFYKWGYKKEGTWYFNLFSRSIKIKEEEVSGKMPENPSIPYAFNLHYASVVIETEDGGIIEFNETNNGGAKLKTLLNEGILLQQ